MCPFQASMAQGVKSAIAAILQRRFGTESSKYLTQLQREGRFQEEIFA